MGDNLNNTKWVSYIDKTKGCRINDLHTLSKLLWFHQKNKRALSLGTGAGNEKIGICFFAYIFVKFELYILVIY